MKALLDASFLLAYLDSNHICYSKARIWLSEYGHLGWATCPLTENACLRLLCSGAYPGKTKTYPEAIYLLNDLAKVGFHEFWPDSESLRAKGAVSEDLVQGKNQITDAYLLLLATKQGGRLVTFDKRIRVDLVPSASSDNLLVLK